MTIPSGRQRSGTNALSGLGRAHPFYECTP